MSLNEEVEMLRRIQLFSKVEPAKLKLLAFTSERAVFQAEEILFHQGDAADAAYIIVAGEVADVTSNPRAAAAPGSPSWARTRSSARSASCATCRAPPPSPPPRRPRR